MYNNLLVQKCSDFDRMPSIPFLPDPLILDEGEEYVSKCVSESAKVYNLYGNKDKIQIFIPEDYNRYSEEMREKTCTWLQDILTEKKPEIAVP